jgi:5,10-methylenetetrahydromethanopterin reductase
MKYSVMAPFSTIQHEHLLPYAAMVEWTGVHRLWQGQSIAVEPHQAFAAAAGTGLRIPLGTAVTLMPMRHPYEAAVQASSLARITGQSLVSGYGPGPRLFQTMLRGEPYRSQLGAVREYVEIMRGLLDGRQVDVHGDYFTCTGSIGTTNPKVEIGLGVLRPGMARLAGQVADVAITWLTPAAYLRDTIVPALTEGAREAGRPVPRVVAAVPVALARHGREPAEVALAGNAAHLRGPHYLDMLTRAGVRVADSTPLEQAAALVESGAFLVGDLDQLRGALKEFEDAGVDEVALNFTGVHNKSGAKAAMTELRMVLADAGVL